MNINRPDPLQFTTKFVLGFHAGNSKFFYKMYHSYLCYYIQSIPTLYNTLFLDSKDISNFELKTLSLLGEAVHIHVRFTRKLYERDKIRTHVRRRV